MNGVEVLRNGFDAIHTLESMMEDVTQKMVDFVPPNLANPIGWNYLHIANTTDWTLNGLLQNQPLIWETGGWSAKLGIELPEGDPHEWAQTAKIPLDQARQYAQAVNQAAGAYLDSLSEADLDRVVPSPIGEDTTLGQVFASFINWHIAAHTGEISALKGIQNLVGYGF